MPKSSKLSIFSTARATEFLQILVPARNPHAQPPSPVPWALDPAFTQREFCCAIVQHFVAFRCATYPAQAFTASSLFSQRAQDEPGRTRPALSHYLGPCRRRCRLFCFRSRGPALCWRGFPTL